MGRKRVIRTPEEEAEYKRIRQERNTENKRNRLRLNRDAHTTRDELSMGVPEQMQLVVVSSGDYVEIEGEQIVQRHPANATTDQEEEIERTEEGMTAENHLHHCNNNQPCTARNERTMVRLGD